MSRDEVMAGSSWDPSYPTLEQASSAAFAASAIGDEVAVHQESCAMATFDDCDCTPTIYARRKSGWVVAA